MGWLYRDEPIDDPLAYLKAKYNYDCDTHTLQTLDGARVRNTVYLAVRSTEKKTGRPFVFAAVILISNTKKLGFGYKDMIESMGPCECDCPRPHHPPALSRSPTFPTPATQPSWRARVAAQKTARRERRQQLAGLQLSGGWALSVGSRRHAAGRQPASPRRHRRPRVSASLVTAGARRSSKPSTGRDFSAGCSAATLAAATITAPSGRRARPASCDNSGRYRPPLEKSGIRPAALARPGKATTTACAAPRPNYLRR